MDRFEKLCSQLNFYLGLHIFCLTVSTFSPLCPLLSRFVPLLAEKPVFVSADVAPVTMLFCWSSKQDWWVSHWRAAGCTTTNNEKRRSLQASSLLHLHQQIKIQKKRAIKEARCKLFHSFIFIIFIFILFISISILILFIFINQSINQTLSKNPQRDKG